MTSKFAKECFVYITLPGETSAVTAGRFVLDDNHMGGSRGRFVYGRSYLENPRAVPIDPVAMPGRTFGVGASSKSTPASRSWARWTIFCSRPTTVQVRLALA
jgi:hypothetical protein